MLLHYGYIFKMNNLKFDKLSLFRVALMVQLTMVFRNYRDKLEKQCCSGSHKQFKTHFKDHMVLLKIISLYIYKDLRLKILGLMSHVTIITRMAT